MGGNARRQVNYMAAEMMSGDLPVTSDADAMAKQRAKEAELERAGTMLKGSGNKRKAGEVRVSQEGRQASGTGLLFGCIGYGIWAVTLFWTWEMVRKDRNGWWPRSRVRLDTGDDLMYGPGETSEDNALAWETLSVTRFEREREESGRRSCRWLWCREIEDRWSCLKSETAFALVHESVTE